MMQKAFKNECMNKTRIKEWYNRFKGGRTSVDSDSRSGRPSTTKTLDNIERVRLAIEGDRRLTVRELENDLGIPKTTVWEILNKILGMTRVCAVSSRTVSRSGNIAGTVLFNQVGITLKDATRPMMKNNASAEI